MDNERICMTDYMTLYFEYKRLEHLMKGIKHGNELINILEQMAKINTAMDDIKRKEISKNGK